MRSPTVLKLAMTLIALVVTGVDDVKPTSPQPQMTASASPLQSARLRKLHLVRPDLINYPLSIDVVC